MFPFIKAFPFPNQSACGAWKGRSTRKSNQVVWEACGLRWYRKYTGKHKAGLSRGFFFVFQGVRSRLAIWKWICCNRGVQLCPQNFANIEVNTKCAWDEKCGFRATVSYKVSLGQKCPNQNLPSPEERPSSAEENFIGTNINYLIKKGYKVKCFWVDRWVSYGDPFEYEMVHYWSDYFRPTSSYKLWARNWIR